MAFADHDSIDPRERYGGAALVILLHAAALYALIGALGIHVGDAMSEAGERLVAFALDTPPAPEPDKETAAEEGAQSEAAEEADPSPVVAPEPKVEVPPVNPIVAAPDPMEGVEADAGKAEPDDGAGAEDAGEGTGTGDAGDGSGAGGTGEGTGAGGASDPVKIAGEIRVQDFRKATGFSPRPGEVTVFYTVRPDGRATDCRVARPSRNGARDALTCQLIEQRFRYEPARNANGEPVAARTGWRQRWWPDPKEPSRPIEEGDFGPR